MIATTVEIKIQDTCDCFWGQNQCPNKAAFLVKHKNSQMYSIMCEPHKEVFEEQYPNAAVEYHEWSLKLNQKFASEVEKVK